MPERSERPFPEKTYWEQVAESRWGQYIAAIEKRIILEGAAMAGPPGVALEVGCEGGRWSAMLRGLGWRMICTDISEESLNVCRRKVPDAEIHKVLPTDKEVPVAACGADLLLCIEVAPVVNEFWFVEEAYRILRPEGIAVLVFWNKLSLRGMLIATRERFKKIGKDKFAFYKRSYYELRKRYGERGFTFIREVGMCWLPFSRSCDSRLIPFFVSIERVIGLRRLPLLSPWIIAIIQKK